MTEPTTTSAGIDWNRGVIARTHRQTGISVAMYKDTPGVYFDENGHEVGEDFARQAGFDVDTLNKQKERDAKMAAAIASVEAEYEGEKHQVVFEAGGFKVRHEEQGKHSVLDAEGLVMSRDHSRGDAVNIVRQLAAQDPEPEEETSPEEGEDVGDEKEHEAEAAEVGPYDPDAGRREF